MLSSRRLPALLGLLVIVIVAGVVFALTRSSGPPHGRASVKRAALPARPDIVFVLTDDLSMNLLRFMPHVQAMELDGMSFENYFVSDSLCCPSRASIFTGDFPHDTGVFSNFGPGGGFNAFYKRGDERRTFPIALQRVGYVTALMGKFLNGYLETKGHAADGQITSVPAGYVPPGFTDWDVAGWGYPEFNYTLNQNGKLKRYGHKPSDYLTDVIAHDGVQFIDSAARSDKPFFLELATFAPHSPYTPAPQDAHDFPDLEAPRPPSFDVLPTHAPLWLAGHARLTGKQIAKINVAFRKRAQAVQAVDRMIGAIEETLAADGIARDTYLIFSSDNGLHTGEYRLMPGKLTAFDTDIHVPLVVVGPGVPAGSTTSAMAENIDLAKTFTAIGGTTIRSDGHSLLGVMHGDGLAGWRNAILVEHHGGLMSPFDPDFQQTPSGNPTTYEAMRTSRFLYVEYDDGEREFYDLQIDPFELHNISGELTRKQLARLHAELGRLKRCHGGRKCWAAMHVAPAPRISSARKAHNPSA
ncbi:MAG TPA: sulfatase [Solirubrobacteraceae bacterium]|nr:sulfatase [Solirubrobacteraceae bacterium]